MVLDELLSFRTHFWPSHFPIEARYYEYRSTASTLTLKARRISTPEELRAFQKEVTRREQLHEWSFLAYYEPLNQQHDERVSA
jgi:hypothetical protein